MEMLLDGAPEFILLAVMLALLSYLRINMFTVWKATGKSDSNEKDKGEKKKQLRRLTRALSGAMILSGLLVVRICAHAWILYQGLTCNNFESLWCTVLFPGLDFLILAFLFMLYLYLLFLHYIYDILPYKKAPKTEKLA